MTYHHGIPHGIAVSIILEILIKQLEEISIETYNLINNFFKNSGYNNFTEFLKQFNIKKYDLKNLNKKLFLSSVNQQRLKNYPFKIDDVALVVDLMK